jgi:hypothetical protein
VPEVVLATRFIESKLFAQSIIIPMLLRQYNFPVKFYQDSETLLRYSHSDHMERQFKKGEDIFLKHTRGIEKDFVTWLKTAQDDNVLQFLSEFTTLVVEEPKQWTGYRISSFKKQEPGWPVYRFEMFERNARCRTPVRTCNPL